MVTDTRTQCGLNWWIGAVGLQKRFWFSSQLCLFWHNFICQNRQWQEYCRGTEWFHRIHEQSNSFCLHDVLWVCFCIKTKGKLLKSSSILHEYMIQYKSIFHEWKQKHYQNNTMKRIFCDASSVRDVCVKGWNKAVLFSSVLLLSQAIDKDRSFSFPPFIFKENEPKGVPCFCEVSSLSIRVNCCPRF